MSSHEHKSAIATWVLASSELFDIQVTLYFHKEIQTILINKHDFCVWSVYMNECTFAWSSIISEVEMRSKANFCQYAAYLLQSVISLVIDGYFILKNNML